MDAQPRNVVIKQVQHRLRTDQVDALVADYVSGMSVDRLAERYAIHRTTVMRHLKRRGVKTRRKLRKLSDDQVQRAISGYKLGHPISELADDLGVSYETLRTEFERAGQKRQYDKK